MPFWDSLATALGREATDLERKLGDRIVVDNLVGAAALRTVLLCESPHHAEISHGHSLAGDSGKTVTRAFARNNLAEFNGRNEPIGCLLHHYRCLQGANADEQPLPPVNGPVLNSLGLMNVSRLPLDSEAYCLDARRQYSELLCYFEAIKTKLEQKKPEKGIQFLEQLDGTHIPSQIYATLRDDLIRRLNHIPQGVKIVPCGNVAKAFFGWAIKDCGYRGCATPYKCLVPHPSRNSWQQKNRRSGSPSTVLGRPSLNALRNRLVKYVAP